MVDGMQLALQQLLAQRAAGITPQAQDQAAHLQTQGYPIAAKEAETGTPTPFSPEAMDAEEQQRMLDLQRAQALKSMQVGR